MCSNEGAKKAGNHRADCWSMLTPHEARNLHAAQNSAKPCSEPRVDKRAIELFCKHRCPTAKLCKELTKILNIE